MPEKKAGFLRKALPSVGIPLLFTAVVVFAALGSSHPGYDEPSWSPDGSQIVYTHKAAIWVMNADGTGQVQISNCGRCPAWSPDGSRIAYITETGAARVMDTDGRNQEELPINATNINWSPDGGRLVFASPGIWVVNEDGSNTQKLPGVNGDLGPAWKPDGTQIALYSVSGQGSDVFVINADGTGLKKLISNALYPAWSPDGAKIAFCREAAGYCDIWVADADGSNQVNLTGGFGYDYRPAWSPDGSKIAFVYEDGHANFIYVMNADGSERTRIT